MIGAVGTPGPHVVSPVEADFVQGRGSAKGAVQAVVCVPLEANSKLKTVTDCLVMVHYLKLAMLYPLYVLHNFCRIMGSMEYLEFLQPQLWRRLSYTQKDV